MQPFRSLMRSQFLRHIFALSSGTAIAQAIALGFLPILTRLYSPEDFGALALYLAIAAPFFIFASFGYNETIMLTRSNKSAAQIVKLIFFISIGISIVSFLIFLFFSNKIATILGAPDIAPMLFFIPLSVFFFANYQGLRFWTMRMQRFGSVSKGQVAKVSANFSLGAALSPFSKSLPIGGGLIFGSIFAEFVNVMWLFYVCRKNDRHLFSHIRRNRILVMAKRHQKMATTITASKALSVTYTNLPPIIISSYFGAGALGFFSMAEKIASAPALLIANAIGDVYRQRASSIYRQVGRFDKLMQKTFLLAALIAIIPYLLAIIFAPDIFRIILGAEWEQAGNYASIILVGSFFGFITTPLDKAPIIVGAHRFILSFNFLRLILNLIAASLVIFGLVDLMGYIIVLTCVRIIIYLIVTAYSWHYSKG